MNPPYDRETHLEILKKMFEVCPDAEIINISPIGWLQDIPATLGWKKTTIQRFENIAKRIKNIDIIEGGNEKFGIGSFIDLGIYSFQKTPSNCFYKTLCFDKKKRKDIFDKIILPVYEGKIDNIANQKYNNGNFKISNIHGHPKEKDEFDIVTPKKEIACNNGNIKVSDPELYHNMLNTEFYKYANMLTRQGQNLKFNLMPHIDVTGKFTRETMNEYLFDLFDLNDEQRKFILETMKKYMWADWS